MKELFLKSQQDFFFGNLGQLSLHQFNAKCDLLNSDDQISFQIDRLLNTFQSNILVLADESSFPNLKSILHNPNVMLIHAYKSKVHNNSSCLGIDVFFPNGIIRIDSYISSYKEERLTDLVNCFLKPIYDKQLQGKTYLTANLSADLHEENLMGESDELMVIKNITRILDTHYDMQDLEDYLTMIQA